MENKDKIFVFGHKNPDTDSIMSAIALADFAEYHCFLILLATALNDI